MLDKQGTTGDVLNTTMCPVEQILSTRPLTAVSDDPEDLTALNFNRFLNNKKALVGDTTQRAIP